MEHVTIKNTIVLKRLVAFMPEFLIRITASSADSRGKVIPPINKNTYK